MKFKKIELSDKKIFDEYYRKYPQYSSYLSFVNLFSWQAVVNFQYAIVCGHIIVKYENYKNKKEYYLIPETDIDSFKTVVDIILEKTPDISMSNLTKRQTEMLEEIYPGMFSFVHKRDNDNYCYLIEKMATLSGKKLHSKKNFVNRFKKEYNYTYEKIDKTSSKECIELLDTWCKNKDCEDGGIKAEACACRLALKYMDELSLKGGILRVDGKIVAFSIGEKYNDEMVIIHFEKADINYKGAFQTIFMEFTKNEWMDLKLVNREEDTGEEGLRKAKLSYYPEFMLEMYGADRN